MEQIHNEEELKAVLQKAGGKPVVVCFINPRCPHCVRQMPHMEDLAQKYPGATFIKIDITKSPNFLDIFSIYGVPLIVFFKFLNEVTRIPGADKSTVEDTIKQLSN